MRQEKGVNLLVTSIKIFSYVVWYIHSLPEEVRKVPKGKIKSKNCLHLFQQGKGVLLTRRIKIIFLNYITRFHSNILCI